MTVEKPKPKQLLRPITTGAGSAMKQSQFLAITCNSLEAREKSRVHGAIGFGFASHWLKNWRESFKPITKLCNRNQVITFDSHLKIALFSQDNPSLQSTGLVWVKGSRVLAAHPHPEIPKVPPRGLCTWELSRHIIIVFPNSSFLLRILS